MSLSLFKNAIANIFTNHMYLMYMYEQDLTLNNLQCLILHKTKPTNNSLTHRMYNHLTVCK